jgi:hypothetical protein
MAGGKRHRRKHRSMMGGTTSKALFPMDINDPMARALTA